MSRKWAFVCLAALFVAVFGLTTLVVAGNQWKSAGLGLHWDKTDLSVDNNGSGGHWQGIFAGEIADLSAGTCFNLSSGGGGADIVLVDNSYGTTGWAGLASVSIQFDSHGYQIQSGIAQMNRTYLDASFYNDTWDQHVTCQELAHDVGLEHRGSSGTCMNNKGRGPYPNLDSHDVETICSFTDVGGGSCASDSTCGGGDDGGTGQNEKGPRCSDGVDNDGDGLIDCDDPDCAKRC